MILLDSNIIIAYLNNDISTIQTLTQWRLDNQALFISPICIAEVLSLDILTLAEVRSITTFLDTFSVLPITTSTALAAAKLRREYNIKLPDAMIAATAIENCTLLATRDKNFYKIPSITIVTI